MEFDTARGGPPSSFYHSGEVNTSDLALTDSDSNSLACQDLETGANTSEEVSLSEGCPAEMGAGIDID